MYLYIYTHSKNVYMDVYTQTHAYDSKILSDLKLQFSPQLFTSFFSFLFF